MVEGEGRAHGFGCSVVCVCICVCMLWVGMVVVAVLREESGVGGGTRTDLVAASDVVMRLRCKGLLEVVGESKLVGTIRVC